MIKSSHSCGWFKYASSPATKSSLLEMRWVNRWQTYWSTIVEEAPKSELRKPCRNGGAGQTFADRIFISILTFQQYNSSKRQTTDHLLVNDTTAIIHFIRPPKSPSLRFRTQFFAAPLENEPLSCWDSSWTSPRWLHWTGDTWWTTTIETMCRLIADGPHEECFSYGVIAPQGEGINCL